MPRSQSHAASASDLHLAGGRPRVRAGSERDGKAFTFRLARLSRRAAAPANERLFTRSNDGRVQLRSELEEALSASLAAARARGTAAQTIHARRNTTIRARRTATATPKRAS